MKTLMTALLTWIAAHSGQSVPATLPDVVVMTQADFELYLCEQAVECESPGPQMEILALFDFQTRTVYVREGFDPDDIEHQSTMVRQLVFFARAHAWRSQDCRGPLMRQARDIENHWRVVHRLAPLPITPLGMLLESCLPGPT